jgi:hypothetical protein
MMIDCHIRFVRSFFGLGFGWERMTICDNECTKSWRAIAYKVYLGPWIIYGNMDFKGWTERADEG